MDESRVLFNTCWFISRGVLIPSEVFPSRSAAEAAQALQRLVETLGEPQEEVCSLSLSLSLSHTHTHTHKQCRDALGGGLWTKGPFQHAKRPLSTFKRPLSTCTTPAFPNTCASDVVCVSSFRSALLALVRTSGGLRTLNRCRAQFRA